MLKNDTNVKKFLKEDELNEWNDTHIPRGRVAHHETGKPKKYWVAIGDDYLINNYSEFVNQSLQRTPLANNANPSFSTQDPAIAKNLAKRAIAKFPDKYVFIGVDDSSRGMMTQKNHLRASIRYFWDPVIHSWNDADMNEADEMNEAQYDITRSKSSIARALIGHQTEWQNMHDKEQIINYLQDLFAQNQINTPYSRKLIYDVSQMPNGMKIVDYLFRGVILGAKGLQVNKHYGRRFESEEVNEAGFDLSQRKGTFANLIAANMDKFNACKTKEEVIALCHKICDEAGLDTPWTRQFFIKLGMKKTYFDALYYVVNAEEAGSGRGISRRRYYECDQSDIQDIDEEIEAELDKCEY